MVGELIQLSYVQAVWSGAGPGQSRLGWNRWPMSPASEFQREPGDYRSVSSVTRSTSTLITKREEKEGKMLVLARLGCLATYVG